MIHKDFEPLIDSGFKPEIYGNFRPTYGPRIHTGEGHVVANPSGTWVVNEASREVMSNYPGIGRGDVIAAFGEQTVVLKPDGTAKIRASFPRNRELLDGLGRSGGIVVFNSPSK